MKNILILTRRHMALFLRNKLNILLSFASIFIVFAIYIFFLHDFLLDVVAQHGVREDLVRAFTDRFMTAGLLVVINTTTCFGVIQICVNDHASGIRRDYLVSPASPFQIMLGYLCASTLVSAFFTCLSALACVGFFSAQYGAAPALKEVLQAMAVILCSSCINSLLLLCLSKNLKSTATFSTLANLYGTMIGFLAGAYLPCYFYPGWLRSVLFYFPPAQATSVLRQLFTYDMKTELGGGMPEGFAEHILRRFGIYLEQKGAVVTLEDQGWLLLLAVLFLLLLLWMLGKHLPTSRPKGKGKQMAVKVLRVPGRRRGKL